jgi:hypothetical protein
MRVERVGLTAVFDQVILEHLREATVFAAVSPVWIAVTPMWMIS